MQYYTEDGIVSVPGVVVRVKTGETGENTINVLLGKQNHLRAKQEFHVKHFMLTITF